jgi:hypothetical protein
MATVALMVARAASMAGASALIVKMFLGAKCPSMKAPTARINRDIDHDIEAAGSSESRLAN